MRKTITGNIVIEKWHFNIAPLVWFNYLILIKQVKTLAISDAF